LYGCYIIGLNAYTLYPKEAPLMSAVTGDDLRQAFVSGARYLELYRDAVNSLNVFPVPDGDTGTNMLLTMRAALERCSQEPYAAAGEAIGDLADGAFWGARGNGGVILSQFLRGFAEGSKDVVAYDAADIARALSRARDAAYGAVGQPVEGTMLTVIHSMSERAGEMAVQGGELSARGLWSAAYDASKDALARTPDMLPVLREAGVVDSGGMGILVIWGGALCHLTGMADEELRAVLDGFVSVGRAGQEEMDRAFLDAIEEVQWGYCTQFIITGEELSPDLIRQRLNEMYESAVIVGDDRNVRVHLHALDPGPPLSYGASMGRLSHIEIQNMTDQNVDFVSGHREAGAPAVQPPTALAVIAVVSGEGLAQLFRDTGCSVVVSGGQTMNPSVGELMDAVRSANAGQTIILPNNKNIVVSAEQACAGKPDLHVIPSDTVPQGVAALLAFNPEDSLEANLDSMRGALDGVSTIEVTRAVRDSTVGGVAVRMGQFIGLVDGDLKVAAESPEQALGQSLDTAGLSRDAVVTLYLGEDAAQKDAEAIATSIVNSMETAYPGIQIDVVNGGQPHYHYLASVE
jgi:DAK2 domain fusion protein YloV